MMKKIISIMLIAIISFSLIACADTTQNKTADKASVVDGENDILSEETTAQKETKVSDESIATTASGNNVLVVYFSVTGNTKNIAEMIASATDADVYEIKPAIEYTDEDIDYGDSNSRTSKEQNDASARPEIQGEAISLEGYDTIYIGYPIWWGEEPRIMDTFVERYDFGEITMIPFCTSGSSGIGNSGSNLAANAGSGSWIDGKRFDGSASESEIEEWISSIQ